MSNTGGPRLLPPGAAARGEDLIVRLEAALTAKGADYRPRTHHLVDGGPTFINRLIFETSPYLLQHAHNPVDWYPWGDEAFETARREGKPVFLSIGYATCHWCHVMEGESFEDEEIAGFMNAHFTCIKVDREERPDIDAVYMSAVQNLTGSGGWPMSVWLTADREPFFAGTYFPPRDGSRGARRGFLSVLADLRATFDRDPDRVKKACSALIEAVRHDLEKNHGSPAAADGKLPDAAAIANTVDYFKRGFDPVHGGLRRAPKFPSNLPIRLLLRQHRRTGDQALLDMATLTLEKMAAGGMYDQIGGGFHRYSTDGEWLVPHFEKMLYDNALLSVAYAEAHQVTRRGDFARVCREILDYVLREMTAPDGGFYSATDADSEGEEGRFFVWSLPEIESVLGSDADRFARHYGISRGGNFEGHNIPHVARPDEGEWAALADARGRLYEVRARREPPLRDEKILAAWNGLMLSGFAVAGRVLDDEKYIQAGGRAADFLLANLCVSGRMLRSFKDGRARPPGFLEDHAFVVQGLLDLYEAGFETRFLREAIALAGTQQELFADVEGGGWFSTAHDGERLLAREKPNYDGAEPSGTSVAIMNALRLSAFTGDDMWRVVAERAFLGIHDVLIGRGPAMTEALLAVDFFTSTPREIAIVWPQGTDRTAAEPLFAVLREIFVPNRVLAAASEGPAIEELSRVAPFVAGKTCQGGKPTAYVCEHGRCEAPTTDAKVLAAQLARR